MSGEFLISLSVHFYSIVDGLLVGLVCTNNILYCMVTKQFYLLYS